MNGRIGPGRKVVDLGQEPCGLEHQALSQSVEQTMAIVVAIDLNEGRKDIGSCRNTLGSDRRRVNTETAAERRAEHDVLGRRLCQKASPHIGGDRQSPHCLFFVETAQTCGNRCRRQAMHRRGKRRPPFARLNRGSDPCRNFPPGDERGQKVAPAPFFGFGQGEGRRKQDRAQMRTGGPTPVVAMRHHR